MADWALQRSSVGVQGHVVGQETSSVLEAGDAMPDLGQPLVNAERSSISLFSTACKMLPMHLPLHLLCLSPGLKVFLLLAYSAAMIALYLAPLGITSPCIMEENQLPPKPALVGHRGAPMVSNSTCTALKVTRSCGALDHGWCMAERGAWSSTRLEDVGREGAVCPLLS